MPIDVEPPGLALLLDTAERPRAGGWSLRSALARYAQPQPRRVGDVLEVLRRITFALRPHMRQLRKDGHSVWAQLATGPSVEEEQPLPLLRALATLDDLGEVLAAWAVDPSGPPPDDDVDGVVAQLTEELDRLGVPRENRENRARPPRRRPTT